MLTSNWEVVEHDASRILLRDLGPWDKHATLTNDAEEVIRTLHRRGLLKVGIRVEYIDSEGDVDALVHDGFRFIGFAPGSRKS